MKTKGHDVTRVHVSLPKKGQFHPFYSTVDSSQIFAMLFMSKLS